MDKAKLRLLSNFIYKMQAETDDFSFRKYILDMITMIIPCDQASFYLAFENEGKLILEDNPVLFNISEQAIERYGKKYVADDYVLWLINNTTETVFRETDFFEDNIRMNTEYYKNMYLQHDIHYSLQACLCYSNKLVGLITLFRKKDSGDFSEDDLFWLELLQKHISKKLYELRFSYGRSDETIRALEKNSFQGQAAERAKITSREQEIIDFILEGYTNEEIADLLFISANTVKKHLSNIYIKLGIKSRWELLKLKQKNE